MLTRQTSLNESVALTQISLDSTQGSNLSVGMPLDLAVIRTGTVAIGWRRRIADDDPWYRTIRDGRSQALPRPDFIP